MCIFPGAVRTAELIQQSGCAICQASWKTKLPEVSMHHLPPLHQFSVEGAQRGRFIVLHLLCGLLEEGHQAQKAAGEAGFQDQGAGTPAKS